MHTGAVCRGILHQGCNNSSDQQCHNSSTSNFVACYLSAQHNNLSVCYLRRSYAFVQVKYYIMYSYGEEASKVVLQIQVTAAVANFLVNEARRNFHEPANLLQEQDLMMYNFCPAYTGKVSCCSLLNCLCSEICLGMVCEGLCMHGQK